MSAYARGARAGGSGNPDSDFMTGGDLQVETQESITEEKTSWGDWFTDLFGWDSPEVEEGAPTDYSLPSITGSGFESYPQRTGPYIRGGIRGHYYDNRRPQFDSGTILCARELPRIELNGVEGFLGEIEKLCGGDDISKQYANTQNNIEFCHEINKKFSNGACFEGIINPRTRDDYHSQLINDPIIREKYIQNEIDQLKEEREKMQELSSLQFALASDPNTVMDLKAQLSDLLKNNQASDLINAFFQFSDKELSSIRDGSISLENFSKAVFSCSPDKLTGTETSEYDQGLLGKCDDPGKDEAFREAYDRTVNGPGEGLMSGMVSDIAVKISNALSPEYKNLISGSIDKMNLTDEQKKQELALTYQADARVIMSMMDAMRSNASDKTPLEKTVIQVMGSDLSEAEKIKKIQGESIRETFHALKTSVKEDGDDSKILKTFQNLYIRERQGEGVTIDFKSQSVSKIIDNIKKQANISGSDKDLRIGQIAKLISSAPTFGTMMYKGKATRDGLISSGQMTYGAGNGILGAIRQSSPDSGAPSAGQQLGLPGLDSKLFSMNGDAESNAVLTRFENYFNMERGAKDLNKILLQKFFDNIQNASKTCSPQENLKGRILIMATTLAGDCKSKINRPKHDVKRNHCPSFMNPNAANAMLAGSFENPAFMEGNSEDSISRIITACFSIGLSAFQETESSRVRQQLADGNIPNGGLETVSIGAETCKAFKGSATVASSLKSDMVNGDMSHICNPDDDIARLAALSSEDVAKAVANSLRSTVSLIPGSTESDIVSNSMSSFEDLQTRGIVSDRLANNRENKKNNTFAPFTGANVDAPTSSKVSTASSVATPSGSVSSGGINSNIFDTSSVISPTAGNSYIPTSPDVETDRDLITSDELEKEIIQSEGGVDPNIQRILDKMAQMEAREKELMAQQNELKSLINNPNTPKEESDELKAAQEKLAQVTAELKNLKSEIPALISDARKNTKSDQNDYRFGNNNRPSADPTPSSRRPASVSNNFESAQASNYTAPASSGRSGGSGGGAAISSASGYSGLDSGSVSADGLSAPAYTQKETFVLTQNIKDRASIVAAGVSIEQAVLENRGAILVPYGNGEYMYVEPQLNAEGEIETRDGRVVYKEVLKVTDPSAIAKAGSASGSRMPASVEEFDPNEKIYDWDDFSRQLDDAQK